jgi:hypothetical protein
MQGEDVGMGKLGRDSDFAKEPSRAERLGELRPKDLDGNLAVVLEVSGEVDCGHPTAPKLTVEGVVSRQRWSEPFNYLNHVTSVLSRLRYVSICAPPPQCR